MNEEKKNLEKREEKKTDLKGQMLSDDDMDQVSGGVVSSVEYSDKHDGAKWDLVARI